MTQQEIIIIKKEVLSASGLRRRSDGCWGEEEELIQLP